MSEDDRVSKVPEVIDIVRLLLGRSGFNSISIEYQLEKIYPCRVLNV